MKALRTPTVVLVLLYVCFLGYLLYSAGQLPDRVATHFDGQGQPNGWMSRSTHTLFIGGMGILIPLGIVALCYVLRWLPDNLINIPRREYWLAPERRADTVGFLFRSSLWFASEMVIFFTALQALLVRANRLQPVQLETGLLFAVAGFLLVGIIVWAIAAIRKFRLPPAS